MDRPHLAEQDPEFHCSRGVRAQGGKLRPSESHCQLSQQPGRRNGGIRIEERRRSRAEGVSMEVEMTIRGLLLDPVSNMPIVILKDVAGESVLPIWVGVYEANAIALEMEKV